VVSKTQAIRLQLAVLVHASRCLLRSELDANGDSVASNLVCRMTNCEIMKGVLRHLGSCKLDKQCTGIINAQVYDNHSNYKKYEKCFVHIVLYLK